MDEELFYENEWKNGADDFLTQWQDEPFPEIDDFEKWKNENECAPSTIESVDSPFENDDKTTAIARKAFGVKFLFAWQRAVIENIFCAFDGDSTFSRQTVILPTGAGKSLCFLLPALILPRPTLVIYPLLSLMKDQKRRMNEAKIECVTFCGGQTKKERAENLLRLKRGAKIAITNPESLQNDSLLFELEKIGFAHIAIDEAHCVSEWGDSFRPSYLNLAFVIERLKPKCATAFTATASPKILSRLGEVLFPNGFHLVRGSSDRANLNYFVIPTLSKMHSAISLAKKMEKPLLIFCSTRSRAEKMARLCSEIFGEKKARFYHAGMTKAEKTWAEKWFFDSTDGVLCATCAYGMGVDKPNIRTVIHLDCSPTVESFCQESGRAGRDGNSATSILLWSRADENSFTKKDEKSKEMAFYAKTNDCRREFLLSALGDNDSKTTACFSCDVCLGKSQKTGEDEKIVLDFVKKNQGLYTKKDAISILSQKFEQKSIREFGFCVWEENFTKDAVNQLLDANKIVVRFGRLFVCRPKIILPPPLHRLRRLFLRGAEAQKSS